MRRSPALVRPRAVVLGFFCLLLHACAVAPSLESRQAFALQLASAHGWSMQRFSEGEFDIASFGPGNARPEDELWVYIEGDGLPYISAEQISSDPTPIDPLALRLALAQPAGRAVYLARPCQYGLGPACQRALWTNRRFSEEVVAAMDQAVSQAKLQAGAKRLTLVGYSGGGAIAALLAERRSDVSRLVTVAGNLSTQRWAAQLGLGALTGSLDPYPARSRLAGMEQWHFVGDADKVVPKSLTVDFATGQPKARVIAEAGFDHHCCWADQWASLWTSIKP